MTTTFEKDITVEETSNKLPDSNHILDNIKDFEKNADITPIMKYFRDSYNTQAEPNTFMSVLLNPKQLDSYIKTIKSAGEDKKASARTELYVAAHLDPLAGIYHRIDRFFLKFSVVRYLINNAPRKDHIISSVNISAHDKVIIVN